MTTLTGYDASEPPANPPATDVVGFYIGGDTPHVWTPAEIARQTARYRLPIWVRSNPYGVVYVNDSAACVAALKAIQAPRGTCVVLDLETAVDVDYCNTMGWDLAANGYTALVYGSSSTLFKNPKLGGYWVALGEGPLVIPANCVGAQWGGPAAWDNDLFIDTLALWDTRPGQIPPSPNPPTPVHPPTPTTPIQGGTEDMADSNLSVSNDASSKHVFVSELNDTTSPPFVSVHHWWQSLTGTPNWNWNYERLGPQS